MVVQASPQITAAQVLNAGRRAEADGRLDYATQFYRHLTEHHAGTPEAVAARDALSRLSGRHHASRPMTAHHRDADRSSFRRANSRPMTARTQPEEKISCGPIQIAPVGAVKVAPQFELPEAEDHYRAGRTIAHGLNVAGILFLIVGLLATFAFALPAELLDPIFEWLPSLHPLTGPTMAVTGVVLMLLAQLARAIFDMANASRDLAAIQRARAEAAATLS